MLNIVLYEPEMPMNTGNIGRSCVATNTRLHLIEPLGFKLNDKMVKRAGLDYWPHLDVTVYSDFKDFLEKNPGARPYMATTKTTQVYTDVHYDPDCYIMFGPESRGIPEELLIEDPERCVRIPMWGETRSLNLSNLVPLIPVSSETLMTHVWDRIHLISTGGDADAPPYSSSQTHSAAAPHTE